MSDQGRLPPFGEILSRIIPQVRVRPEGLSGTIEPGDAGLLSPCLARYTGQLWLIHFPRVEKRQ